MTLVGVSTLLAGLLVTSATCFLADLKEFHSAVMYGKAYVDNSLLIKDIMEDDHKVIIITRPPKWGKSTSLDMLYRFHNKTFASECTGLSKTLRVLLRNDVLIHQDKFSALKISLADFSFDRPRLDVEKDVGDRLAKIFRRLKALKKDAVLDTKTMVRLDKYISYNESNSNWITREEIVDGWRFATEVSYMMFNKTSYVFVDDYDLPFLVKSKLPVMKKKSRGGYLANSDENYQLFEDLYRRTFVNNKYLEKAVLTGVLKLDDVNGRVFAKAKDSMIECTLLDEKFSQFFGIRAEDVDELKSRFTNDKRDRLQINRSYGGYNHSGYVYHPALSISFHMDIDFRIPKEVYHVDVSRFWRTNMKAVQRMFTNETAAFEVVPITLDNIDAPSTAPNLLLYTGLLNPVAKVNDTTYLMNIPNELTKRAFLDEIEKWNSVIFAMNHWVCEGIKNAIVSLKFEAIPAIWRTHAIVEEMNVVNLNAIMISFCSHIWFRTGSDILHYYHSEFRIRNDSEMLAAVIVPDRSANVSDTAFVIGYELANNESRLEEVAMECADNSLGVHIYGDVVSKYDYVKKVKKVALAFHNRNSIARCVERDV